MKRWILLLLALLALQGCAATQVSIEKKDLKVETLMSQSIFLDVETPVARCVFIDIKNTSDRDFDLHSKVADKLRGKGYTIANAPREAGYILQVNVLQVGESNPSALRESVYGGFGSTIGVAAGGAAAGSTMSGNKDKSRNAVIGGLLGATIDMVSGSMVKDVTFSILTDVQVIEKGQPQAAEQPQPAPPKGKGAAVAAQAQAPAREATRKQYQTRIASYANQVNLKFEEAALSLQEGLSKSISNIF